MSDGKKFDGGKPPVFQGFDQYFPRAKRAVANVSAFGKEKYAVDYDDQNWRRVEGAKDRYRDACARHVTDEQIDGLWAPDSKLLHAAHCAWNALAYLELLLTGGVPERREDIDTINLSDTSLATIDVVAIANDILDHWTDPTRFDVDFADSQPSAADVKAANNGEDGELFIAKYEHALCVPYYTQLDADAEAVITESISVSEDELSALLSREEL